MQSVCLHAACLHVLQHRPAEKGSAAGSPTLNSSAPFHPGSSCTSATQRWPSCHDSRTAREASQLPSAALLPTSASTWPGAVKNSGTMKRTTQGLGEGDLDPAPCAPALPPESCRPRGVAALVAWAVATDEFTAAAALAADKPRGPWHESKPPAAPRRLPCAGIACMPQRHDYTC